MARRTGVTWHNAADWSLTRPAPFAAGGRRGRRGAAPVGDTALPEGFLAPNVSVLDATEATPKPQRRAAEVPLVDFSVPVAGDEAYVVAIRHPSGALTFHTGERQVAARRGTRRAGASEVRFRIPLRVTPETARRRGIVAKAAKVIILKVTGIIADALLPRLVSAWEKRSWKERGLTQGWLKVDAAGLKSGKLVAAVPTGASTPSGRTLLLLHGTFSHTASAFQGLSTTDFFAGAQALYGDQIFAFNHFTLSKTPEENARDLLAPLTRPVSFDVVTHSRGGLVLRNLTERREALGAAAKRFDLHHAVLVASPNDGTPLATPTRWQDTVGWLANLLEHFPDNPLTFAASFVAEAIVWLAQRAAGGIPGLAAMDSAGTMISELQDAPGPAAKAYSALVANFSPDDQLLLKMLDVGIDAFFAGANDLVVPTEGGWRIDQPTTGVPLIPSDRIGCYGPGGNFARTAENIHHLNFFARAETAEFLLRAMNGEAQGLVPVDPAMPLPDGRFRRGAAATRAFVRPAAEGPPTIAALPPRIQPDVQAKPQFGASLLSPVFSDTLQLTILEAKLPESERKASSSAERKKSSEPERKKSSSPERNLQLLASYAGARVITPFVVKGEEAGQNWHDIIRMHERIKNHVDGKAGAKAPEDKELIEYGKILFKALFPPEVLRLYDVARSRERAGHLNVIFTSMVPWIADKPWEFAFDPNRETFLASEELHFIRNAITSVSAEKLSPRPGALRILIAVAQPIGTAKLSSEEEEAVIRRGFEPMIEAGLVEVEVLRAATPASLHRWISTGEFDVVHFVGHGEFDEETEKGYLLFEDGRGEGQRIDVRTAREILCQRGIRLVFLNACDSGRGARADFNRGVAPGLLAAGLPAVVANQFSVLDQSATEFSQHFYWALAQGMTLGAAAREARIAVNYSINGENIDWAIPVVYARDPESRLCEVRAPPRETIISPFVSGSRRRATAAHKQRVAVWDMNHIFPNLDATLHVMNAAQEQFGFELVDVTAPIGTWQRYKGADVQLHANVAAKRLRHKTQDLQVDFLFCITDHLIMFEEDGTVHAGYYNWWSDPGKENIIIFSAAFPDIKTSGREADRAIANVVVQGLTGILADTLTHERTPRTCPLYRNPERSLEIIVAPQKFDATCQKMLKKRIPDSLPALEALLRTFD